MRDLQTFELSLSVKPSNAGKTTQLIHFVSVRIVREIIGHCYSMVFKLPDVNMLIAESGMEPWLRV